ncbi:MAG TPA: hypothetical protein VHJ34_01335 [Actinomycetota bacterium]|nr:hypothetical protein [Actinomycetota bacterium]
MRLRLAAVVVLVAALTACRSDRVDLVYRFEEGDELRYRLEADAATRWNLGEPGSGSYRAEFTVTETVRAASGDEAIVAVTVDPVSVEGRGLLPPGGETRTFELRVGARGQLLEVLEVDGAPATGFDPDELAFINTARPKLPVDPVRLRQSWPAEQQLRLAATTQELAVDGRLAGLGLDDGRAAARLTFTGAGPLTRTTQVQLGDAELVGSSSTTGAAVLDLDGGYLTSASSRTESDFEVRVLPEDGAPLSGTLHTELRLELTLLD